jgi:flagellin
MSSINTNVGAFTALRNLNSTNSRLDTTLNHISTGKKVSGPKEDASIFAIAQGLSSDLGAFNAVQQTLSSATGVTSVAIAGATQVSDLLTQLKSQAIQAANPANTPEQQSILAAGFQQTLGQIGTVIGNAQYNGVNLLSAGSASVSVTSTISGGQTAIASAAAVSGVTAALSGGVATTTAALSILSTIDAQQTIVGNALGSLGAAQKSVDFTSTFQQTLSDAVSEGLGSLVDSNLATEAAKLRALQVQQQLGHQTLNIANQRAQTILSLFKS